MSRIRTLHEVEARIGETGIPQQEYGSPLRYKLKGYWKLKISDYRVIYKIEKEEIKVPVLKIGKRRDEEIYNEMLKRLKKL